MNNPVQSARDRLVEIEKEMEKLKLFLAAWENVADLIGDGSNAPIAGHNSVDESAREAVSRARTRAVNPPTETVVKVAIEALRQRGHPMSRRELHAALWSRGVEVKGTDPVKTLGTILWRAQDRVIQLEGYGYWPRHMSYSRANYLRPMEGQPTPPRDVQDLLG